MFLDTSITTNSNAFIPPAQVAAIQSSVPTTTTTLSTDTTKALTSTIVGAPPSPLTALTGTGGGLITTPTGTSGGIPLNLSSVTSITSNPTLNAITGGLGLQASNYLGAAIKSVTGTFGGAVTALASGIDSALGGIFNNTNVKTASTTTSLISDPIKTNLLDAKTPGSTSFKVGSLEVGSQSVSMAGSSSQFGTNASSMIGTSLSTVLNRLNLDSTGNLASSITNAQSTQGINGLFSEVGNLVKTVAVAPLIIESAVTRSLANDVSSFLGVASPLSAATGVNPLSYYQPYGTSTLLGANNQPIFTNNSGVDSTTANGLLAMARLLGCSAADGTEYSSADQLSSLFNMILSMASQFGMNDVVNSLLGCGLSATPTGQTAVTNAFTSTTNTDAIMAAMILPSITNQSALNTTSINQSIVTNPNLRASDVGTVNTMMTSIGSTPQYGYAIPSMSNDATTVYDTSVMSSSSKTFMDGVFGDTAFSTYTTGSFMSLNSDGSFTI